MKVDGIDGMTTKSKSKLEIHQNNNGQHLFHFAKDGTICLNKLVTCSGTSSNVSDTS